MLTHSLYVILAAALALMAILLVVGKVPLRYNLRNLEIRWLTTSLMALAFTLVIGLLVVMLAFVNGMYALTRSSGRPENVLILAAGATDEAFSSLGFADTGDIENQPGVARSDGMPLCSRETYLVVNQPIAGARPGEPRRRFLQMRGIDDPRVSSVVHEVELLPGGQWFSAAGVEADPDDPQRTRTQVVLGQGIARVLARDPEHRDHPQIVQRGRLDIGDTFTLANQKWIVVGVMNSAGKTFDSEVWAKRSEVASRFNKNVYSSILLRAENVDAAQRLKEFFVNYRKAPLEPALETEYFAKLQATNLQFLIAVIVLAVVMALGGIFGVMNTMFAAISQRTKDIGVLRILGYARWQILISFLLESLIVALVGGLIGCGLAYGCHGWTATSIVGTGAGSGKSVILKLVVDGQVLSAALVLTIAMGLLGGLIPAISAMRLKPLDAVR